MENIFFVARMYISRFLIAIVLTYVYVTNTSPSNEGKLTKNSPAFFSEDVENATAIDEQGSASDEEHADAAEANQE